MGRPLLVIDKILVRFIQDLIGRDLREFAFEVFEVRADHIVVLFAFDKEHGRADFRNDGIYFALFIVLEITKLEIPSLSA